VKLTQFWQQLMLRFALIGAVLAVCVMWGGLVTPAVALSNSGTTALAPIVSLSATSLSFGSQQVNTPSAAKTVMLTNTGTTELSINNIEVGGTNSIDFAQTNDCPILGTLAAQKSCTINVIFTPTDTGRRSASVTITDNASNSTQQSVVLSGTGVLGMPPTGSDPYAQPPADNTQQVPFGWLALIVAVVAAAGIGTMLISGRLRKSRPR
jgi:Cep192 domain 4